MKINRVIPMALLLAMIATGGFADDGGSRRLVRAGEHRVPNQYIVVLADDVPSDEVPVIARQLASAHEARVDKIWSQGVKGFSVTMTEARAEALSRHPKVKWVEEVARTEMSLSQPTNVDPETCDPASGPCSTVSDNRLWHLDRLDQNFADPNNTYNYCSTGNGVTVYVVDTGVMAAHQEFAPNQVHSGVNVSDDHFPATNPCLGWATVDANATNDEKLRASSERLVAGHGTAVASVLGGQRVGVAKGVKIVPVKVSRCDSYSARLWKPSRTYAQYQTIFRVDGPNTTLYRAQNAGTSGASGPANWSTTAGDTISDGSVSWIVLADSEWETTNTTAMLLDGLNWILANHATIGGRPVVTLSTFFVPALDASPNLSSVEAAIRALLADGVTVIASANNQNGNACDTTPGRMSANNPDTSVRSNVITVGGTMIINRPWSNDPTLPAPADGGGQLTSAPGLEPSYDPTKPVREGRWICGAGDSTPCMNPTAAGTMNPALATYRAFSGGSNAGPCVTLFAPAKNISVASLEGPQKYRDARTRGAYASGTSFSAPIAAGMAARILQASALTPAEVRAALLANSESDVLDPSTLNTSDHTSAPITGTPNKVLRLSDVNITAHPQSGSGTPTLSVTASGTSAVSYQWYEVDSDFDSSTWNYGAHPPDASTAISGATLSSYAVPASSTTKRYWVRVTNGCGSADSTIAEVTPSALNPPTAVTATANGSSVTVTWIAAQGVTSYQVERKIAFNGWTTAGTSSGTTFTESPAAPGGMVVYRVRSVAGQSMSAPSNNDFANLASSTYEPLLDPAQGGTVVKAQQLVELRKAVNALREAIGLFPYYSAAAVLPAALEGVTIEDFYFTDLLIQINVVRDDPALAVGEGSFSPPAPGDGVVVYRTQLQNLRDLLQ